MGLFRVFVETGAVPLVFETPDVPGALTAFFGPGPRPAFGRHLPAPALWDPRGLRARHWSAVSAPPWCAARRRGLGRGAVLDKARSPPGCGLHALPSAISRRSLSVNVIRRPFMWKGTCLR